MKADSILRFPLAWSKASDFMRLAKPGLTSLVVFTAFVGFCGGIQGPVPFVPLLHTLIGTALTAAGASAFTMYAERRVDALMKRTALRPLASGKLRPGPALVFALGISLAGFVYLLLLVNALASLLSVIIFAGYLFFYTPLKAKTWLCTLAGAVPGALPVVLGWVGAHGSLSLEAWVLFSILFLWQLPHFYAISWMHREDYARAGLPVLPAIDRSGKRTAIQVVLCVALLMFCSFLPVAVGSAGAAYLAAAIFLGTTFLAFGIHFARRRDRLSARRLFVASAWYLPALLIFLLLDRLFS